ncbi:2-oxoglutarate-dependent dioxygenase 11 [Linum perenne]
MLYAQMPNNMEGYGQAFVLSEEQKLDWGDILLIQSQPANERNMRFWPRVPSSFRSSLEQYLSDVEKLALTLVNYMAMNLGIEPEKLQFNDGAQGVRMNYYPPCKQSNKVMGITPHSDPGGLTLLTQVNDVQGLQIRKDGIWVPVVPTPGAFIINIGDIIEMMSNGEYKSIEHRSVVNPEKERISIATFHSPSMKAIIGPIPELINEKNQVIYKQLINHGVTEEVVQKMKMDVQEFFNQPLQEKMSCGKMPDNPEGYGQVFVLSEEQKLDWADVLFVRTLPVNARNMRHWPRVPSSFRDSLDQYSSELEKLVLTLVNYMARNLVLEPEKLLSLFNDGTQGVRMNYYPPCKESTKVMGFTPHSDPNGLTLVTQVNDDVQGLQIRKDGRWVPVVMIPGAFIVNVGDVFEIMSNGEYKSIEHRAVVNPEKERISIATFHSTSMKAMVEPIPELINGKKHAKYQSIARDEFEKLFVSSKLDGKRLISQLMIDN